MIRDEIQHSLLPASAPSVGKSLVVMCAVATLLGLGSTTLQPKQALSVTPPQVATRHALPPMPDFSNFNDPQARKQAFFQWLTPYIERENRRIESARQRILALRAAGKLNDTQLEWLADTAADYDVAPVDPHSSRFWELLLRRVDVVPVSLTLAQAANESGWGTSRFAIKANNLFGEWCFSRGCGIVPADRSPGQFHEVRKFSSVSDSVRSYLHNLNTHHAFVGLRRKREALREQEQKLEGSQLVEGLLRYSARGEAYVQSIWSMIHYNRLDRFDKPSYLD